MAADHRITCSPPVTKKNQYASGPSPVLNIWPYLASIPKSKYVAKKIWTSSNTCADPAIEYFPGRVRRGIIFVCRGGDACPRPNYGNLMCVFKTV